jgi:hypothetical protein
MSIPLVFERRHISLLPYRLEHNPTEPPTFNFRLDDVVLQTAEPWASKLRDQRNIGDEGGEAGQAEGVSPVEPLKGAQLAHPLP